MPAAGTFLDLSGPPFMVSPGSTYALSLLVPATMGPSDVTNWLQGGVAGSAPSSSAQTSQAWQVQSLHPGTVSGAFMGYVAIATWNGPAGATVGSATPGPPGAPEVAAMALWAPGETTAPPLPPPPNAPLPFSPPGPPMLTGMGMAVFGGLGLVLGAVAGHFGWQWIRGGSKGPTRIRAYGRANPIAEIAADSGEEDASAVEYEEG